MIRNINAISLMGDCMLRRSSKKVSPDVGEILPLMYESPAPAGLETFLFCG